MSINIVGKDGKTVIKISDEVDSKNDIVVEDGKEVPYEEAAQKAAAKKAQEVEDKKKDGGDTSSQDS